MLFTWELLVNDQLRRGIRADLYVAPYSRPVPYSRHPPYSRHFFNDTHENDRVWALFPIAVSGDHFSTQVCKEILSILSIFFGEASERYHAKLFSPDVSLFHRTLLFLKSLFNSRSFRSFFPCLFCLKLPYIVLSIFLYFSHQCCSSKQRKVPSRSIRSTMLPHEKYTRARILTDPEAVDLIKVNSLVNEVFGFSVGLG